MTQSEDFFFPQNLPCCYALRKDRDTVRIRGHTHLHTLEKRERGSSLTNSVACTTEFSVAEDLAESLEGCGDGALCRWRQGSRFAVNGKPSLESTGGLQGPRDGEEPIALRDGALSGGHGTGWPGFLWGNTYPIVCLPATSFSHGPSPVLYRPHSNVRVMVLVEGVNWQGNPPRCSCFHLDVSASISTIECFARQVDREPGLLAACDGVRVFC